MEYQLRPRSTKLQEFDSKPIVYGGSFKVFPALEIVSITANKPLLAEIKVFHNLKHRSDEWPDYEGA
jgi:hypothetical protein